MSFVNEQKDCEDTNKDLSEQFRHHVSERVKLYEASMKGSGSPAKININKNNNIRHVVPVCVLIVFFTLYLTTTAIQFKYLSYGNPEDEKNSDFGNTLKDQEMQTEETTKRIKILEKLLEYKDLCTELEVFTKDLRWVNEIIEKENQLKEIDTACEQITEESVLINLNVENGENHDQKESKHRDIVDLQHTNKDKSEIPPQIDDKNAKNNNSTVINNNNKKDQSTAKKSNTAEPIIYMFALVFIYLLLKAASDINQHYKSQNKGDKRLRRCSLQSYAQTHKQDRRASKDSSSSKSKKESLLEMRSQSVDRFNDTTMKKSVILSNLRKFTSFDEHKRIANIQCRIHGLPLRPSREKQSCGENSSNILEYTPPKISGRRCSVPISLSFQRHNVKVVALPISNLARRTSLSGAHIGLETNLIDHGQDIPFHEVKRRVRMINRH
ncbi:uncharacterized protein LOC120770288 [Bactrocera tryoni]|uniref:uncharacterized protein LOC120770288 n=1 Tax=Bactrocera tryoni TaxID=59916 RepID=UPI001A95FA41|nr:uncharacterized protein LOC120770288 [Bactrocera tryoni]